MKKFPLDYNPNHWTRLERFLYYLLIVDVGNFIRRRREHTLPHTKKTLVTHAQILFDRVLGVGGQSSAREVQGLVDTAPTAQKKKKRR